MEDNLGNILTKEQEEFFQESKIRDSEGNLLVCFHGTENNFDVFDYELMSRDSKLGLGFYFTKGTPLSYSYPNELACYLNITKPIHENDDKFSDLLQEEERLMNEGKTNNEILNAIIAKFDCDGIIGSDRGHPSIVAFSPSQIKLIDNKNPTSSSNIKESLIKSEQFDMFVTDSVYGAKNKILSSNGPLRIFIDEHLPIYLIGDPWECTHTMMVELAQKNGYKTKINDFDKKVVCAIYTPLDEYGNAEFPEEDAYEDEYNYGYSFNNEKGTEFKVYSRYIPFSNFELYKVLSDAYGKPYKYRLHESKMLKEEILDIESGILVTESPYEVKNYVSRNDKGYRILWDGKHGLYFVGSVDDFIHRDFLQAGIRYGYLSMESWDIDNYIEDELEAERLAYILYIPNRFANEVYGTELGEDGYDEKYQYKDFIITTRESNWLKCPLSKVFGKYEKHYTREWNDEKDKWDSIETESLKLTESNNLSDKEISEIEFTILNELGSWESEYFYDEYAYYPAYEYIDRGFITRDGCVLDTFGNRHYDVEVDIEDYLEKEKGIPLDRFDDRITHTVTDALGWIRVNGWNEDYICLSSVKPTEAQYASLERWLDEYFAKRKYNDSIRVTDYLGKQQVTYDPMKTGKEIVNSIKRFYITGTLTEKLDESLLTEKSRQELINKSRKGREYSPKNQARGKNRWERRRYSQVSNTVRDYNKIDMDAFWKGDILEFTVKITGETDIYEVNIIFEHILRNLEEEVKGNNNKLEFKCVLRALLRAFNGQDVYVNCSCPDFKYRFAYNATKGQYNSGAPELRPNRFHWTNKEDDMGAGCKHINLVLSNTDWMMKIASVINNYIKWCKENMSRNYADYIFPKVYGMPYNKAIQLSLFDDPNDNGLLPSDQDTISKIIDKSMQGRKEKGQWATGNEYRFKKQDTKRIVPEDEPGQLHLDLGYDTKKKKQIISDEGDTTYDKK